MDGRLIKAPDYLGDGVYAHCDGYQIWLVTEPLEGRHEIALEPEVFRALIGYANRIGFFHN